MIAEGGFGGSDIIGKMSKTRALFEWKMTTQIRTHIVKLCALLVFVSKQKRRERAQRSLLLLLLLFLRRHLTTHVFVCSSNTTQQQRATTTTKEQINFGRKRRKVFIRQRRINRTQRANQLENVHLAFHFERINRGDLRRDRLDRVSLVLLDDFGRWWSHRRVSV